MKSLPASKKALVASLIAFFSLFTLIVSAQNQVTYPYVIQNNLSCSITLNWGIDRVAGCPGTPCNGGAGVVISAGASFQITAADFTSGSCPTALGNACNITVKVYDIGGTSITPVTADFFNPGPLLPFVSGCSNISANMIWTVSQCDVNP